MITSFRSYLEKKHIVPEKQRGYYIAWVTRFISFLKRSPDTPVSKEDLESFISSLSLKNEEW